MSSVVFPQPSTSSISAYNVTATSPNIFYSFANTVITAGVYRFTCVSSTVATIYFYNGSALLTTAVTSSGTVDVSLSTAPTKVAFFTNTGSNVLITFTFLAAPLSSGANGTVDTLTTSQTYTQTGPAFVVVVGGGGGGAGTNSSYGGYKGGGGGSGGVQSSTYTLTGSTVVTIGAAGNKSGTGNDGNAGGATTFGNLTSNGGGGGSPYEGGGLGGTPGGVDGGKYNYSAGQESTASSYPFVVSGTTGSGSKGGDSRTYGSGIGTSGPGGANGGDATGYGSGGGGGGNGGTNSTGGNGRPGVVYVLRGF
jgi:hypothetical protein